MSADTRTPLARRPIAVHSPGRFRGELSLLTGQPAFHTAVVEEPGEVLQVPVGRLLEIVSQDAALGDLVLRAYLLRRELLSGLGAGLKIVGSRFLPDTRRCATSPRATAFPTAGRRRSACGSRGPVDAWDYLRLAWLASSLGTIGGALGATLETDEAVREAAYAYRPEGERNPVSAGETAARH